MQAYVLKRDPVSKRWGMYSQGNAVLLLSALKRKDGFKVISPTTNFAIFMELLGKIPYQVAKVSGSVTGKDFHIYDMGKNPKKARGAMEARRELGAIQFSRQSGVFTRRIVHYAFPKQEKYRRPSGKGTDDLFSRARQGDPSVGTLFNHLPHRPKLLPRYENFDGLVGKHSIKNIILHDPTDARSRTLFILAKNGSNSFQMFFRYPFNPVTAFATALASIDSKVHPQHQA